MKFKSLKFLTGAATCYMLCAFIACNDESGNNSSTLGADSNTSATTDSATSGLSPSTTDTGKNNSGTISKKSGKASAKLTADGNGKIEKDKMGYYTNSEVLPDYNGGHNALENYITNNIEYPQDAIDNNVEGTVSVHFLVDEKGNISDVSTVGNKFGHGLEEEAVRVVSKMPAWTPGKVKGKNVKTWRTLPITYRLEES